MNLPGYLEVTWTEKINCACSLLLLAYDRLESIYPCPCCLHVLGFLILSIQVLSNFKEYFLLLCAIFIHS